MGEVKGVKEGGDFPIEPQAVKIKQTKDWGFYKSYELKVPVKGKEVTVKMDTFKFPWSKPIIATNISLIFKKLQLKGDEADEIARIWAGSALESEKEIALAADPAKLRQQNDISVRALHVFINTLHPTSMSKSEIALLGENVRGKEKTAGPMQLLKKDLALLYHELMNPNQRKEVIDKLQKKIDTQFTKLNESEHKEELHKESARWSARLSEHQEQWVSVHALSAAVGFDPQDKGVDQEAFEAICDFVTDDVLNEAHLQALSRGDRGDIVTVGKICAKLSSTNAIDRRESLKELADLLVKNNIISDKAGESLKGSLSQNLSADQSATLTKILAPKLKNAAAILSGKLEENVDEIQREVDEIDAVNQSLEKTVGQAKEVELYDLEKRSEKAHQKMVAETEISVDGKKMTVAQAQNLLKQIDLLQNALYSKVQSIESKIEPEESDYFFREDAAKQKIMADSGGSAADDLKEIAEGVKDYTTIQILKARDKLRAPMQRLINKLNLSPDEKKHLESYKQYESEIVKIEKAIESGTKVKIEELESKYENEKEKIIQAFDKDLAQNLSAGRLRYQEKLAQVKVEADKNKAALESLTGAQKKLNDYSKQVDELKRAEKQARLTSQVLANNLGVDLTQYGTEGEYELHSLEPLKRIVDSVHKP